MGTLGAAVLVSCGAGMISCIIGSVSAGGSSRALLKLMINCVVVVSLLSPFTGINAEDAVNLSEEWKLTELSGDDAEEILRSYDVRAAELSLKLELEKLLKSKGIDFSDAVISCTIDEYDVISVSKAEVTVSTKEDADKLENLSAELMQDFPLTIITKEEQ